MATVQEWLNTKFNEWERSQGRKQSYYAFARYLEVSQSELGQWMIGAAVPNGEDVQNIASKLGVDIFDVLGLPRPNTEAQRFSVSFASLPPDIRRRLASAIAESDQALRTQRLGPESAEARTLVLRILEKWGFRYTG